LGYKVEKKRGVDGGRGRGPVGEIRDFAKQKIRVATGHANGVGGNVRVSSNTIFYHEFPKAKLEGGYERGERRGTGKGGKKMRVRHHSE